MVGAMDAVEAGLSESIGLASFGRRGCHITDEADTSPR